MTIIQKLIDKELQDTELNKVVKNCLNIKELELYIANMDKVAAIYNKPAITIQEQDKIMRLEEQQDKFEKSIRKQIGCLIGVEDVQSIRSKAEQIVYIMQDKVELDGCGLQESKLYLVAKFVKDVCTQKIIQTKNSAQIQSL